MNCYFAFPPLGSLVIIGIGGRYIVPISSPLFFKGHNGLSIYTKSRQRNVEKKKVKTKNKKNKYSHWTQFYWVIKYFCLGYERSDPTLSSDHLVNSLIMKEKENTWNCPFWSFVFTSLYAPQVILPGTILFQVTRYSWGQADSLEAHQKMALVVIES